MKRGKIVIVLGWMICLLADHLIGPIPGMENVQTAVAPLVLVGAIIAGASALAGGLSGSISANRRKRKAAEMLNEKERKLDAWRDAQMGTSELDKADSRNLLRRMEENMRRTQKKADTDAVRSGMTDEAKSAQAGEINRGYADAASQIAAIGERRRDAVRQQYRREKNAIENARINGMLDTSGSDALVQGLTGAGASLGTSLAMGGFGKGAGNVAKQAARVRSEPDFSKVSGMASRGTGIPSGAGSWKPVKY